MGEYVYKVTRHTVELSNGETANVAVFAYKPTWNWDARPTNEQMHVRSGAAKCDANADKRSEWIVLGFFDEKSGKIQVEIESTAKKVGKRGSFSDSWFDIKKAEGSAICASLSREIMLTRTETVGDRFVTYGYNRRHGWKQLETAA